MHMTISNEAIPSRGRGCGPSAKAALHAEILHVATDLFYRKGIQALSVDELCDAARITKPTLYRHFGSKDRLVAACVADDAAQVRQRLDTALDAAGTDPRAQVRAVARFYADAALSAQPRGMLALNAAVEYADPDHPVRRAAAQAIELLKVRLVQVASALGPSQGPAIASQFLLMILGSTTSCQTLGVTFAASALVDAVEAMLASAPANFPIGDA
jgi:AcrR family transcriptional regulator